MKADLDDAGRLDLLIDAIKAKVDTNLDVVVSTRATAAQAKDAIFDEIV